MATKTAKKPIGLDWQNNNFARASPFVVHFFAVAARIQREKVPNFTFCRGREHKTTIFFFLFLNFTKILF